MHSLRKRKLPYAVADDEDYDDDDSDDVVGGDVDDVNGDATGNPDDDVDRCDCLLAAYSIFSFSFSFQFYFHPHSTPFSPVKLKLQFKVELLTPILSINLPSVIKAVITAK